MPTILFSPEHHAAWELGDMRDEAMNRLSIATVDLDAAEYRGDERTVFAAKVAFLIAEAKAHALNEAWLTLLKAARALEVLPPAERGF